MYSCVFYVVLTQYYTCLGWFYRPVFQIPVTAKRGEEQDGRIHQKSGEIGGRFQFSVHAGITG
jgi:hypothetical protein